jgi:sulfopyruvate decarboxylase subunit alpha
MLSTTTAAAEPTVGTAAPSEAAGGDGSRPYAQAFMRALHAADVKLVTALPESLLKHVYRDLAAQTEIRYVPVTNEAEMPGIVAGAYFGGIRALMMMENSGLRQACEPIARFALSHQVPMVMVMPYRGDLGEKNWWGHSHAQTMEPILNALRIPFWHVRRIAQLDSMVDRALDHAASSQLPVALILGGECVNGGVE